MKKILKWLILSITVIVLPVFSVLGGCSDGNESVSDEPDYITGDEIGGDETTDTEGGTDGGGDTSVKDLVISLSDVTTNANFFGVTVDGVYMEVIALKYGSSYRTSFNTCRVCYGMRTAYYKQSGSYLVCQYCGSKFALSKVGVNSAGYSCSPYPILSSDRTLTEDSIIIPYSFLVSSKNLFKTWKVT